MTKEEWLTKRREELLPCGYFHMVFTIPHVLNALILNNKRELLNFLFSAVRDTLFAFAADPKWRLEGKPGLLTILHTWSQTLIDHFHIHCLIPAGVLSTDGKCWMASKEDFLFHVVPLAKEFKKRYLNLVKSALHTLVLPENSSDLLQQAWDKDWIVYAKKPFAGPDQVLKYLGRYTHRVAIANHRIKAIDDCQVTFAYKDRSDENRSKTMNISAIEFIRRFLLHVLPHRFMKIGYFGFLANNCKAKAILLIRGLIGKTMVVVSLVKETIREKMLRLTGNDILHCPHCRQGNMILHARLQIESG